VLIRLHNISSLLITIEENFRVLIGSKIRIWYIESEFREDSIRDWREAGEKGENREGKFIRDSDSLREREWTQDKSTELLSAAESWFGGIVR